MIFVLKGKIIMSNRTDEKEMKNGINLQDEKMKVAGGVITQDPKTGKWWVFGDSSSNHMRIFNTREEAIEWAKKVGYSTQKEPWYEADD